jgi:DNA-binding GntR family transcriptional regulator
VRKNSRARTVLATPIYDALKERIMDGEFESGARLNIDALAAKLNVSPTPVREALARLAAEKLVTCEPFKGYSVSPLLTPSQFADMMHVRHLLEKDAARLAATRINLPDLLTIEKALYEIESLPPAHGIHGYRQFNQLDQKFHELVVGASGNTFLLETYCSMNIHIQLARFYHELGETDRHDTLAEHYAVYEALRAHDPEAAARAIQNHLNGAEVRIYKLMETHFAELAR